MIVFPEYAPDISDYNAAVTAAAQNVLPRGDGYGPVRAFSAMTAAFVAQCRGYFFARKSDGSVVIFGGTSTKLYKLDNTDFTLDDVSKAAGTYSTLSSDANWDFEQFGNLVFATQANAVLQVFDMSSSTEFADCAGSPPQAAYITTVGRFLLLTGLLSTPYRAQWCGLNATTTWTQGVNQSDYQDFPDGGIVRSAAGVGDIAIVTQDGAIRRMIYAPGSPTVFNIQRVTDDHGILAPYSLTRANDRVFYLSLQGFKMMQATGVPEPIGREKVDRTTLADIDQANLRYCVGAVDPQSSRVFFSYKSNSSGAAAFDKIIAYDWVLQRFSPPMIVSGEYLATMSQPGITLDGLDALVASIDDATFSLDDLTPSSAPGLSIADTAHKIGFFRGANLEAQIETAEYGAENKRVKINGFRPITDAPTLYGAILSRENMNASRSVSTEQAMNSIGMVPAHKSARYMRGRIRIPAGTAWTFASGVEPIIKNLGAK